MNKRKLGTILLILVLQFLCFSYGSIATELSIYDKDVIATYCPNCKKDTAFIHMENIDQFICTRCNCMISGYTKIVNIYKIADTICIIFISLIMVILIYSIAKRRD
jgi:hypothetical protein